MKVVYVSVAMMALVGAQARAQGLCSKAADQEAFDYRQNMENRCISEAAGALEASNEPAQTVAVAAIGQCSEAIDYVAATFQKCRPVVPLNQIYGSVRIGAQNRAIGIVVRMRADREASKSASVAPSQAAAKPPAD